MQDLDQQLPPTPPVAFHGEHNVWMLETVQITQPPLACSKAPKSPKYYSTGQHRSTSSLLHSIFGMFIRPKWPLIWWMFTLIVFTVICTSSILTLFIPCLNQWECNSTNVTAGVPRQAGRDTPKFQGIPDDGFAAHLAFIPFFLDKFLSCRWLKSPSINQWRCEAQLDSTIAWLETTRQAQQQLIQQLQCHGSESFTSLMGIGWHGVVHPCYCTKFKWFVNWMELDGIGWNQLMKVDVNWCKSVGSRQF